MPLMTAVLTLALALTASPALADALPEAGHAALEGSALTIWWALPFICMLLSIAILPLALPVIWAEHFGKIAAFWALCFLAPCAAIYGPGLALGQLAHTIILECVPFIILLFALIPSPAGCA